ncbi:hypothetical protein [Deinococcus roseus]|uniref:FeoB-associated Cys-rich membrane protein n=1 Tax=Deinococcus roseus TaxID=392414 RepID=A0ABQ2DIM4_9DEIO|nr:hypothetical protein [Deinococcus roseus]GGJ56624.1 hypothetical protein GCM10008938_48480 [Deinococcus roseus]
MEKPKELVRQGFYQGIGQSAVWLLVSAAGFALGYHLVPKDAGKKPCGCGGNCGGSK